MCAPVARIVGEYSNATKRGELARIVGALGGSDLLLPVAVDQRRVDQARPLLAEQPGDRLAEQLEHRRAAVMREQPLPLGLVARQLDLAVHRQADVAEILGVVGHREEVERRAPFHRASEVMHLLALGVGIGFVGRGFGLGRGGIERVAGVQVQVAEIDLPVARLRHQRRGLGGHCGRGEVLGPGLGAGCEEQRRHDGEAGAGDRPVAHGAPPNGSAPGVTPAPAIVLREPRCRKRTCRRKGMPRAWPAREMALAYKDVRAMFYTTL
jgi:hypothetical protein